MNEFKVKNGLIVEGQAIAQGVTASLFGTASWANNAISASVADFSTTASFALNFNPTATASYAISSSEAGHATTATSSSFATQALSASWAPYVDTGTTLFTGSTYDITSSWSNNSISSSHALSADNSLNSTSASYAISASKLINIDIDKSIAQLTQTSSNFVVVEKNTGSFIAGFFDYAATSGSNTRAGMIFGTWAEGVSTHAEFTTVDVGNTDQVSMSIFLTGSLVQLLSNVSVTSGWTIRALGQYV